MIRAIAVDDELPSLKILETFSENSNAVKLERIFYSPAEAYSYIMENDIQLIFLDINMPSISGIEFYKSLRKDIPVIFTTAYSEYAVEGFNLKAIDYLLKPFSYDRFLQSVQKIEEFYNFSQNKSGFLKNYIYFKHDYKLEKVYFHEIDYIEALGDYLKICLNNEKPIVVRMTMKNVVELLPANLFIRVHRSFIVKFNLIKSIRNKTIEVKDRDIPIGATYEEELNNKLRENNIL